MPSSVTVATFWKMIEAESAVSFLESEEVAAWLADDGIAGANPLLVPAVGGIRVLVSEADAQRAHELLSRADADGFPPPDGGEVDGAAAASDPADESVREFLKRQG
jgi:hypothetical protein